MTKQRLDKLMTERGLTATRSEAESWIKLGRVTVDGKSITKPGFFANEKALIELTAPERYVSRAGLKLASVAKGFQVDFRNKVVLDVGSSTGGFTDYALQNGAKKVYAVDVGTDQLHYSLQGDRRIELHEKTDIRDFTPAETPDIIVIDVSFVSLRQILPHLRTIGGKQTAILAMVKPQFEARRDQIGSSGVIKNDAVRRSILRDFELWAKQYFATLAKADSDVHGSRGNKERFYHLSIAK
jgi:23S rRNA (cytidine1920-2'-O)/16S rRNA (cytidine1409-2'-O)-methyltransferase